MAQSFAQAHAALTGQTSAPQASSSGGISAFQQAHDQLMQQSQVKQAAPATPTPTQTIKAAPAAKPQQNDLFSNIEGIYNGIVGKIGSVLQPQTQQIAPKVVNLPQGMKLKFTSPPVQTPQQSLQSAQMTTTPKSLQQQKQVTQTASKVKQGINTAQTTAVNGLSGVFHGTLDQLQQAISDPLGKNLQANYKANPKKTILDVLNTVPSTISSAYKDVAQNQQDVAQSIQKNGPVSSKTIAEELSTISKDANFVFSPLTSLFAAADKVPGLSAVSKILTLPFTAAGEGGAAASNKIVDALPLSQNAKTNLKPALAELTALAAQLAIGKISEITPGKKAALIDKYGEKDAVTIVNKAQELAKEKTVEPGKYAPQELRNQVMQKGIEDTPHGQEILKATLEADQAGKHIEIQPESVHNFEQNIQDYRSFGGETAGTETENAALRDIQASADNPEVKAHTQEQVKAAIQTKELPVNEDGTVTLYRGGKTSEKNGLSSASYDKSIAEQFTKGEPVQEFKVKPEDIKAFIGKAEKEVLVEKGRVNPEEKPKDSSEGEQLKRFISEPGNSEVAAYMGEEKVVKKIGNIEKLQGENGSFRYIYRNEKGEIISAVQGVSGRGKNILSNIYTIPEERNKGIASKLFEQAKKDYKNLEVADTQTEQGAKFFGSHEKKATVAEAGLSDTGKFEIKNDNGARSFGSIKGDTANIVNINAGGVKGSHFFEKTISELENKGVKTINVKLQNEDSQAALKRMVEKGILENPRNPAGSSMNEYNVTYDIANQKKDDIKERNFDKNGKETQPSKYKKVLTTKEVSAIRDTITAKLQHLRETSSNAEEYAKGIDALVNEVKDKSQGDKVVLSALRTELNKEMYGMAGAGGNYKEAYAALQDIRKADPETGALIDKMDDHIKALDETLISTPDKNYQVPAFVKKQTEKPKEQAGETIAPVGQGKTKESAANKHLMEQLAASDPQHYEYLVDKNGKVTYNVNKTDADYEKAAKLVTEDPQRAYDIAKGKLPMPDDQTATALSVVLLDRAAKEGKWDMVADLSPTMSLRNTRFGQENAALRGRFDDSSPHAYIQKVIDARLRNLGKGDLLNTIDTAKKYGMKAATSVKAKALAKIDTAVEKAQAFTAKERSKINFAQKLLDDLTCK